MSSKKFLPSKCENCEVCEQPADTRHFNALVCHACAAFFRRTVAQQKSYKCNGDKKCEIRGNLPHRLCRYCRFQKCLGVGMKITQVQSGSFEFVTKPQEDLFLDKLIKTRHAIEFNRMLVASKTGSDQFRNRGEMSNFSKMGQIGQEEVQIFKSFLEYSGLNEICNADLLTKECIYSWTRLEMAYFTLKYGGVSSKKVYFIDGNYFKMSEDYLLELYHADNLKNIDILARNGVNYLSMKLDWIKRLQDMKIDTTEFTVLINLALVITIHRKLALDEYGQIKLKRYLDNIFKSLTTYYGKNAEHFATRLCDLTSILEHFQVKVNKALEHGELIKLSARRLMEAKMESSMVDTFRKMMHMESKKSAMIEFLRKCQ